MGFLLRLRRLPSRVSAPPPPLGCMGWCWSSSSYCCGEYFGEAQRLERVPAAVEELPLPLLEPGLLQEDAGAAPVGSSLDGGMRRGFGEQLEKGGANERAGKIG
mmetsp:Transcript_55931/g.109473  ORF Transcript_55931/g.109473 Transcript_55931/m.109473 type:complete len:104 (-) Transcript_55931:958-1269(-)